MVCVARSLPHADRRGRVRALVRRAVLGRPLSSRVRRPAVGPAAAKAVLEIPRGGAVMKLASGFEMSLRMNAANPDDLQPNVHSHGWSISSAVTTWWSTSRPDGGPIVTAWQRVAHRHRCAKGSHAVLPMRRVTIPAPACRSSGRQRLLCRIARGNAALHVEAGTAETLGFRGRRGISSGGPTGWGGFQAIADLSIEISAFGMSTRHDTDSTGSLYEL